MTFPSFYDAAPRLVVCDPLSAFLGAAEDGLLEYGYADAVRLAGHSCPTVAGAYLMTIRSLERLYPDEVPERGAVAVSVREAAAEGVAGVMASVATLLTGATESTGFKGIAGRFDRRNLLSFGVGIQGTMAFVRMDTGAGVQATLDSGVVPVDPAMPGLLQRLLSHAASPDEVAQFRILWQERVRRMLVDHADDPRLVRLAAWNGRPDA
ncbi:hypothetical protein JJL56_24765 [Azospirillum sp. YIM DDC1]|uniref:Formylmethanofuran dehydrogenase subunit E domain-containing protein n=1 Tax=Azospirillum aestuarii TaxID=2802052 RepID=A0ABS1I512_9PROT|nr:hypothetical protein [Azospirillum aestuarii]MBK4722070.1 hypothetical protein [Azospirillum aestuarii]